LRNPSYVNAKLKRLICRVSSIGLLWGSVERRVRFGIDIEEAGMRVVTGGDWSIGLALDSSLDSALVSACLGEGLREVYSGTVGEPLPSGFGRLLAQISDGSADVSGTDLRSDHQKTARPDPTRRT
jgi:hypothetical protein